MELNLEEIIKIPKFGRKQTFDEISSFLSINLDYDKTLFKNDNSYASKILNEFIEQVTNTEDDRKKLSLLYSLRNFYSTLSYSNNKSSKSIINLIYSFDNKALIPEIAEHLDDEKQIEDMSEMLEKFVANKRKDLTQEEINEILEKIIPEIQSRKQLFLNKKEQEEKQRKTKEKDDEIITKLEDFRRKGYEKNPSWEVAYQIRELSRDDLKISAMENYFGEACNKIREDNTHIPTFQLLMTNELDGITEIINSMDSDENKKLLMKEYLDKTFDFYKDLYASFGEKMEEFYLSEYENYKFRCILSLENKDGELARLQQEGKLENYFLFERKNYISKYDNTSLYTIAEKVAELDSDTEKFEELKSGDIRKAIKAHAHSDSALLRHNKWITCSTFCNKIYEF